MKSRQRASAKPYRIVFSKAQAGVFAIVICAGMGASFGFGYLWGTSGASSKKVMAEAKPEPAVGQKGERKEAERETVAALIKTHEREAQTGTAKKPADVIKPKFYQDLLKEDQENKQPIEPIKLPEVKKEIPPKPAPPPAAAVEEPPEREKPIEEKADEKKENTNGVGNETPRRAEADAGASKPWTKASGYTIQVVSVQKFDEALRVVRKLRDAGFQPFIKNVDLGARGKWYRVRVGHYRDKAEAQKTLSEMRARTKLQRARIMAI